MRVISIWREAVRVPLFALAWLSAPIALATDTVATDDDWQFHGQATYVDQYHPAFKAAYSGAQSLNPAASNAETADITLFAGRRLWDGAELWINPEIDQGFGLSDTLGVAGFPSGEAYKIGAYHPYLRISRVFLRQVFDLGGDTQPVESGPNQFAQNVSSNNLTLTLGKFSVVDLFDNNDYAHDPRGDFLNWALIDGGAFDYAADPWGFTDGIALEWNAGDWTLRGGLFQMSEIPNAKMAGLHPQSLMAVTELERRFALADHPGKIKLLVYADNARMGTYADALALAAATDARPDTALVRQYAVSTGAVFNIEQEIVHGLGVFARVSERDGQYEAYEFSDIDRSLSAGLALQGEGWGRPDDKVGIAAVVNSLSANARRYFAAGGLGILIGDGALDYGQEQIAEAFYAVKVVTGVTLTADYQHIVNPAYNEQRGPVSVYALRLHAEF